MLDRKARIAGLVGVALAASSMRAQAQVGVPGGAAAAAPGAEEAIAAASSAGGASAVATAAPSKSIFSMFGITKANCQACKQALCQSQIGMMVNSMLTGPIGGVTGGFIPPLCPPAPSASAIAAMAADPAGPGGAKVVAAKIQQSEADAKARVAAVEYLGTVDCSHWPEATKALKNALRNDPNECVRFAAARALNSGCCCSKEIIDALKLAVSGEDSDDNAPETSPRVKAAAFAALQNCLMRVPEELPPEPVKPVIPPRESGVPAVPTVPAIPVPPRETPSASASGSEKSDVKAAHFVPVSRSLTYQEQLRRKTYSQTVEEARRTLFRVAQTPQTVTILPSGKQDLLHALTKARKDIIERSAPRVNPKTASVPKDSGVETASYGPPTAATPGGRVASKAPNTSESLSNRGLFGLLFKSRTRQAGE